MLTATDAKERQHWINMIRAVAEFHSSSSAPVQPPPSNFQRSASLGNALSLRSTQSVKLTSSQSPLTDLKRHHTVSHHSPRASRRVFGPNISPTPPNPVKEELKDVKDALNSVDEYHASVVEALEVCYFTLFRQRLIRQKFSLKIWMF